MSGLDDMTVSQPDDMEALGWAASGIGGELAEMNAGRGFVRHVHELSSGQMSKAQLMTLLDDAMCAAVRLRGDGGVQADLLEMHAHFHATPSSGGLIAEGEITRWGRSVVFVEARVTDRDGVLCARATSTARLLKSAPDHRRGE